MQVICLDLEGVLVPEIWIAFASKTNIPELQRTTRDEPDYGVLMKHRLEILRKNKLKLDDVQSVIATLEPLEHAATFLNQLRQEYQVIILSDTFYEFSAPLMKQLGYPTLFCHRLLVTPSGDISNYHLRMPNHKAAAVEHLQALNFQVIAAGDSYNDLGMLKKADVGMLFHAKSELRKEQPNLVHVLGEYDDLLDNIRRAIRSMNPGQSI